MSDPPGTFGRVGRSRREETNVETLININRNVAEVAFGPRRGRPTISTRAGGVISKATGMTAGAGKTLFHIALVLIAVAYFAKRG